MGGQYFGWRRPLPALQRPRWCNYVFTLYALNVARVRRSRAPLPARRVRCRAIYPYVLAEATYPGTYIAQPALDRLTRRPLSMSHGAVTRISPSATARRSGTSTRIQGQLDVPLQRQGLRWQATRVAAALADEGITALSLERPAARSGRLPSCWLATAHAAARSAGLRERALWRLR